jgi:hypothetical protein
MDIKDPEFFTQAMGARAGFCEQFCPRRQEQSGVTKLRSNKYGIVGVSIAGDVYDPETGKTHPLLRVYVSNTENKHRLAEALSELEPAACCNDALFPYSCAMVDIVTRDQVSIM